MKALCLIILSISFLAVIISVLKSKHILRNIISSTFQGLMSLLAVNVIGLLTGISIAINWYTIAFVSVFGMPSCIALLLIDVILR